jgi:single-stranded-DNA-specific exonuclease
MDKKWVLAKPLSLEFQKKFPEVPSLILQLLFNRGLKQQKQIDGFLNPDYGQDVLDPFLFPDMEKAVERIYQAVANKEKITIHGDYDADGVSSTVLIADILQQLKADFNIYIPHRDKEGYGLNEKTVNYLAKKKTNLIITVDCAISNYEEVELAKAKGIDVIITDHHSSPPKLPKAFAIINPKVKKCNYSFQGLSGVGVAFKLAQAVIAKDKNNVFAPGYEKWLLDLVAIGTVADVMPLLGENRALVKYGLIVLNKTRRKGLKALAEKAGVFPVKEKDLINSENIGFVLAPRINAAGRMDHANTAYELLVSDKSQEISELVDNLEKTNQQRQRLTEKIMTEIRSQIKDVDKEYIIIAAGKDWPLGVIGLAAGRIKDEYNRPVLIISKQAKKIVGSGRSIDEFNLIAALGKLESYFDTYGGHPGAAGFSLKPKKKIDDFKKEIIKITAKELKGKDLRPKIQIEAKFDLEDLNWELFEQIEKFEPFGTANPKPLFMVKNLKVENVRTVGKDNGHLKLFLKQEGMIKGFDSIGFRMGERVEEIKYGDNVDVVCEINLNEFNGTRKLELRLVDFKKK